MSMLPQPYLYTTVILNIKNPLLYFQNIGLLKTYLSIMPLRDILKYVLFEGVISKKITKSEQCACWEVLVPAGPTV